jgi:hypothetical protein
MPLDRSYIRSRFSILQTIFCLLVTLLLAISVSCSLPADESAGDLASREDFLMSMTLNSEAFDDGGLIPNKYTCD